MSPREPEYEMASRSVSASATAARGAGTSSSNTSHIPIEELFDASVTSFTSASSVTCSIMSESLYTNDRTFSLSSGSIYDTTTTGSIDFGNASYNSNSVSTTSILSSFVDQTNNNNNGSATREWNTERWTTTPPKKNKASTAAAGNADTDASDEREVKEEEVEGQVPLSPVATNFNKKKSAWQLREDWKNQSSPRRRQARRPQRCDCTPQMPMRRLRDLSSSPSLNGNKSLGSSVSTSEDETNNHKKKNEAMKQALAIKPLHSMPSGFSSSSAESSSTTTTTSKSKIKESRWGCSSQSSKINKTGVLNKPQRPASFSVLPYPVDSTTASTNDILTPASKSSPADKEGGYVAAPQTLTAARATSTTTTTTATNNAGRPPAPTKSQSCHNYDNYNKQQRRSSTGPTSSSSSSSSTSSTLAAKRLLRRNKSSDMFRLRHLRDFDRVLSSIKELEDSQHSTSSVLSKKTKSKQVK